MISLIAAISENNCIGKENTLPWYLPEDLKRFKKLTTGHVVLMGRKTWESIPDKFRPLPNRTNVVITRQENYTADGAKIFKTIQEALKTHKNEKIFVIGGGQIYKQTIDLADTLHITHVKKTIDSCDVFFPKIDPEIWKKTEEERHEQFSFVTYIKKIPTA